MTRSPIVIVVLLIAISGCPQGTGGEIDFEGEINATEDGFRLDGEVSNSGLTAPVHRNVTLYLYTPNGTVIAVDELGTLNESNSLGVSMRTERVPKYVVINSPDFWQHEGSISVDYYVHDEDWQDEPYGAYVPRSIDSKDEFPVTVPPNGATPPS